ncbi:sulfatase [Verrucomicrobiota bacterium]
MIERPNIIQITTHDSGRHFGCYGHSTLQTPIIDDLAADGVKFTNYFCTVPICSASRACQLTGLYPQSNGLLDLTPFGWRIKDDVQHMSRVLKTAGYHTLLFGIQHEVLKDELDRLAFDSMDELHGIASVTAVETVNFLRKEAKSHQPFYAQIGFIETHTPFDRGGTEPDSEKDVAIPPYLAVTDSSREAMAGYQGSIRKVDSAVGMILDALRESGLEDNTLLVFTTDHGIEMPRSKWFLYDPGIGIGMIMRYPQGGLVGGKECDLLMSNVDYLPTILELAQLDIPKRIEGRSFAGELRKDNPSPVREAIFGMYQKNQTRYVRTNQFKLIRHFDAATDFHEVPVHIEDVLNKRVIKLIELFDLDADPNEFNNLADQPEHADTQSQLDRMLWEWMESVNDPLLSGPMSTPSYEAAHKDYVNWKGVKAEVEPNAPADPP